MQLARMERIDPLGGFRDARCIRTRVPCCARPRAGPVCQLAHVIAGGHRARARAITFARLHGHTVALAAVLERVKILPAREGTG
eukprot:6609019-Prymnesium_polylepis.3